MGYLYFFFTAGHAAIDRYLLPAGHTAANLLQQHAAAG